MVPIPVPDYLVREIDELRRDFQQLADKHSWVAFYVPLRPGEPPAPFAGESIPGPICPAWGHYGVTTPHNVERRPIVDHVEQLTHQAEPLLECVLRYATLVPTRIRQDVLDARKLGFGFLWIQWLRWYVPAQHICRYQNYAQVAATALFELRSKCLTSHQMNHSDAPEKMAAFIRKVQERLAGVPACGDQIKFEHWQDMLESLTDEARLIQHPTGMAVPEPRTLSSIEDLRLALQQLLDWGSGSRKRRIPKAEAEELVASYLAAQGNPNEATVAKVSQATGVSTGAISQTEAWKEFRSYREGSKATKSISPRTISLSDEVLYARADDSADRHDYQIEMTEAEEAEEVWEQILQSAESSTERARLAGMNDDERQMAIQQFRNESQRARAR